MSPNIVLYFSISFILAALIIDMRQKPYKPIALWVPLIWYALVTSRNVSYWIDVSPQKRFMPADYLSGNPIDRMVYSILITVGILIVIKRRACLVQIVRSNKWLFAFFCYMGISILWSEYAGVSFKRWIRATGVLVMTIVVLTEADPDETISTILRWCFFIHLPLSIVLIKYFRTIGIKWDWLGNEMWVGVTLHKNALAELAMVSGIYFIWNLMRKLNKTEKYFSVLYLFLTLWLLKGSSDSSSVTSIFGFLLGITFVFGCRLFKSNPVKLEKYAVRAFWVVPVLFFFMQLFLEVMINEPLFPYLVKLSGRDMTLTGRTLLWTELMKIAAHKPILGVGYGSFWIGDLTHDLWTKFIWEPGQGHNGYIDIYLELGLLGISLFVALSFSIYKKIIKDFLFNYDYAIVRFALFIVILLHNLTESSLTRGTHHLWFLFLLISVSIPRNRQNFANLSE